MDDSGPVTYQLLFTVFRQLEQGDVVSLLLNGAGMLACLLITALCAASENAFYSHRESDLEALRQSKSGGAANILHLLAYPKHLLATILVLNSLGMVAFVVISTFFNETLFDLEHQPLLRFFIDAVAVTLIILIFGEVMPKVYATGNYRSSGLFLGYPMRFFMFILWPFTSLLVKMSGMIEKRVKQVTPELTPEELSHAIDITGTGEEIHDKDILKGIVNIGQIQVRQIMRPRMDVIAVDSDLSYSEILKLVREMKFSRLPVYSENLDNITGMLYIKKLLPHLEKGDDFDWMKLTNPPFFVPESKMIDDLLHEFRANRNHLAIVVDEFGGTSGIVTLEDILEEVFGEMNDEFDDEALQYSRLDEATWLFEGKVLLVDFIRITRLPVNYFDSINEETDTLGGLVSEIAGKIPARDEEFTYRNVVFKIDAADLRKVKRLKITVNESEDLA